jgi:hypothetical protein
VLGVGQFLYLGDLGALGAHLQLGLELVAVVAHFDEAFLVGALALLLVEVGLFLDDGRPLVDVALRVRWVLTLVQLALLVLLGRWRQVSFL